MQVRGCQLDDNGQHPCQKWPQVCKLDEKTGNISTGCLNAKPDVLNTY